MPVEAFGLPESVAAPVDELMVDKDQGWQNLLAPRSANS
jgi:hypothetical protein